MRILALVTDDARRALERALGSGGRVVGDVDVHAAVHALRQRQFNALVVDPGLLDDASFAAILPLLKVPRSAVLLYTKLTPHSAKRILQAEEEGAHELLLRGVEDAPEMIRAKLAAVQRPSVPAILFNRVAGNLRQMPESVQAVTVSMFGGASMPRWVNEVADAAGMGRRTIDRWMLRSGFRGTGALLDGARLARVWEPLVERKREVKDVAATCGYGGHRLLTTHVRRWMGVTPSQLGGAVTREQFIGTLAERVLRA